MAENYTEERYYRIKGSDGRYEENTLQADEMMLEWVREEIEVKDEMGNPVIDPMTGQPQMEERKERFVPEFDVDVTILSEKPTDRNYYTSVGIDMFSKQLMTGEDLWYTIEEGKFPPRDDILEHVATQNVVLGMTQQMSKLDPQQQQQLMQMVTAAIQELSMQNQQQQAMQKQQQGIQAQQDKIMQKQVAQQNMGGMV
jgi:hypothetical protein